MRPFFITVIFFLNCIAALNAQDTIAVFHLPEQSFNHFQLQDSLKSYLRLHDLPLSPSQLQFVKENAAVKHGKNKKGEWVIFDVANSISRPRMIYVKFCLLVDSVQLFVFPKGGAPRFCNYSSAVPPAKRDIPAALNFVPVTIGAQEHLRLLVYVQFNRVHQSHFTELTLSDALSTQKVLMQRTAFQYFFAGVILLLSLMSLIAAILLKNRALWAYTLFMPFWIPYFFYEAGLSYFLLNWFPTADVIALASVPIIFIIAFGSWLWFEYLPLRQRLPGFSRIFIALTIITCGVLIASSIGYYGVYANYVILIILLAYLGALVYLSWYGQKEAQRLLLSVGILGLFGVLQTLSNAQLLPAMGFAVSLFQIGVLLFSVFLFIMLAQSVNHIRQARQQAEALNALKSKFFEDVSHELRTPLSLVLDPLQKVRKQLAPGPQHNLLGMAEKAALDLKELVNQILDLSKVDFSPPELNIEPIASYAFTKILVGQFESLANDREVSLELTRQGEEIYVQADAEKLRQVLYNLVSNALKFTPSGGWVRIAIADLTSGEIKISVQDNGPGISAEALPHIFERFYQDPKGKPTGQKGTGIGLALTKALVEQQGGSITAKSSPAGTTFSIVLPAAKAPELTRPKPRLQQQDSLKPHITAQKAHILVVEDHNELRNYLQNCLEASYHVSLAKDGAQGIALAREKMPDLVISDLMMPHKNGYALVEDLKSQVATSHIPVILLTAKTEQVAKNKALALGADDYLLKPFNAEELLLRVQNVLHQREIWRQKMALLAIEETTRNTENEIDRKFLKGIQTLLETHYANPDFNVSTMATEAGLSKTHLNRKLNALAGESAVRLIQNYRLQMAHAMLQKGSGNVQEIAWECGFNSAAYFTRCFKEKFGVSPGKLK